MRTLLLLLLLGSLPLLAQKATLSGTLTEAGSGEALVGVNVYLPALQLGAVSNTYGFYSLTVEADALPTPVVFSYLGYENDTVVWNAGAGAGARVDLALRAQGEVLGTVEVSAGGETSVRRNIGVERLSLQSVTEMPVLLGEKDIFKGLQLLPGVSNPREGFGGLYVRGGSPDQNLILLDGAPVYNAFHLFGFLSVFNADALSGVDLYKGNFPARYGGRVASVVDVRMKEGNREKFSGSGGIGLVSSRLTLETPFAGKKGSILVSGRRTYFDLVLGLLTPPGEKNQLYFYDGSAKVNYQLGKKDRIFVSAYTGRDNFGSVIENNGRSTRDAFNWGNRTFTARWNHQLGQRAFLNVTGIAAGFDFRVQNQEIARDSLFSLEYVSGINDLGVRADLDWYLSPAHSVRVGVEATRHDFNLATVARSNVELGEQSSRGNGIVADELAAYVEDEFVVSPKLTLNYGLRLATFRPDTGATYGGLEPRLALSYQLSPTATLKAGYAFTRQYLHLLSNSGPGLPTSLWVPAGGPIGPQRGHQYSAGVGYQPAAGRWDFNAEVYYRDIAGLIGYKNGATFLLLDLLDGADRVDRVDILDQVTTGDGRAYGLELAANYRSPKLTTNVAYTLARVESRLAGVNDFNYFAANQDRRHDLSVNGNWRFHPKLSLSYNFSFGSGVPTTLPRSWYAIPELPGTQGSNFAVNEYTERNGYRMRATHRLDLGLRWKRAPRWGEAFWELGVYNVYARANPFFLTTFATSSSPGKLVQQALFPAIPSISYQFKF